MKLKQLSDVLFNYYYKGRPKATALTLREPDVYQYVLIAYGDIVRKRYLASMQTDEFGEADIAVISDALDIQTFTLSDTNFVGMKRADMTGFELLRLPHNSHFPNVYPMGGQCGSEEIGTLTQVRNGEESFYIGKAKFSDFRFFVVKGSGLEFYNLPPCVDSVGIESTYAIKNDTDISLDMAYDVSVEVFAILFKEELIPGKVIDNPYDANAVTLKNRLADQENN